MTRDELVAANEEQRTQRIAEVAASITVITVLMQRSLSQLDEDAMDRLATFDGTAATILESVAAFLPAEIQPKLKTFFVLHREAVEACDEACTHREEA